MNHIMLDLETLGTKVGAIFTSIGAVQFDIETGQIGSKFIRVINIDSAVTAGRTVEAGTLQWWMAQDSNIRSQMFHGPTPLLDALHDFTIWVHNILESGPESVRIWGNSASFDVGKLQHAYESFGLHIPWDFRYERCYRSYIGEFKDIGADTPRVDAHDPIADCEYQIARLHKVWKKIRLKTFQDSQFEEDYCEAVLMLAEIKDKMLHYVTENEAFSCAEISENISKFLNGVKQVAK
jgi:hypothetical protein